MNRKTRKRTATRAGQLTILACLCFFSSAGVAGADRIEGAWELIAYELEGKDVPVSGLLVFAEQQFGMIYTMGPQARSGRAHAGTYEVRRGKVYFEVREWLQKTEDSTGFVPGKSIAAELEWGDGGLILRFDGGSVQKLRRIDSREAPLAAGAWEPEAVGRRDAEDSGRAALAVSGDRFILLHLDEATLQGQAYGGTLARDGRAAANWAISVEGNTGSAAAGDAAPDLTFTTDGGSVVFRDREGKELTFARF